MNTEYHFIEHTADMGIALSAPSLAALYEIAGRALFDLIAPRGRTG